MFSKRMMGAPPTLHGLQRARPTMKISMAKEAIGIMPLAVGALVAPHAAGEAKKNLAVRKGMGGAIVTPRQLQLRRQQVGMV
jgi:hypothetical protein